MIFLKNRLRNFDLETAGQIFEITVSEQRAITSKFLLSHSVFKRLVLYTRKNPGLVWERVKDSERSKLMLANTCSSNFVLVVARTRNPSEPLTYRGPGYLCPKICRSGAYSFWPVRLSICPFVRENVYIGHSF